MGNRAPLSVPPARPPATPSSSVPSHPGRPPTSTVPVVVSALALVICALTFVPGVWSEWPLSSALAVGVAIVLLTAGTLLVRRPRSVGAGLGLLVVGALWPAVLGGLHATGSAAFLGWSIGGAIWAVFAVAMCTYPDDLPLDQAGRWFLVLTCIVLVPVNILIALVSRPEWNGLPAGAWWPTLHASRPLFDVVSLIYGLACLVLAGAAIVVLGRRLRRASGIDRVALLPAFVGVGAGALAAAVTTSGQALLPSVEAWAGLVDVQSVAMLAIPLTLGLTAARARLARAGVAEMVSRLTRPATPAAVQRALRTLLRDESVQVLFWDAERRTYVDDDGEPLTPPPPGTRQLVPVVTDEGSHLALVAVDPRLEAHADLVDSAVAAVALALENASLQARLRAQLVEVRASRSRLLQAQMDERRRLGRNLHDGAQQNLLALGMRLEAARMRTGDDALRTELAELKAQTRAALADIRDLAHGLHPAVLTQAGLAAAVAEMVERGGRPVRLDLPRTRMEASVETAAYFVVAEGLANATKHAGEDARIWVTASLEGDQLVVRIEDDGPGGADPDGSGLRGLADRLQAVGGALGVGSPIGSGTTLEARIPR